MERLELSSSTSRSQPLSFWVTVAFTVNYIIGSGFLTIPWGFTQAGSLLGICILVIFGLISTLSVYYILETIERAQILEKHNIEKEEQADEASYDTTDDDESHELINRFSSSEAKVEIVRKREIPELCEIFIGKNVAFLYIITVSVFVYGVLWAYSSVFSHSFAALFPIFGDYSYYGYLFLFACFVIPLSVRDFSEQAIVQVILSFFRFCMFLTMFATIATAYRHHKNEFVLSKIDAISVESKLLEFHLFKMQYLVPIAAFAFLFHHAIPSLSHSTQKKTWNNIIFSVSILICAVSYILLGLVVSLYFGEETSSACNLNWKTYVGSGTVINPSSVAVVIRSFILLFPAIDVASAFPLNALSLGNNLMSAYYGKDPRGTRNLPVTAFRLLAACPPLLGALIFSDLGYITNYTGIMGLLLVFVFPPLLSRFSESKLRNMGLNPHSLHTTTSTHSRFQTIILSFGIVLVVYVTISLTFWS
jgi:amino acid permease